METDYTPWPGNPRASEREKLKFRIPCPTAMLDHIVSDTDRLPNLLQYKGCADVSVSGGIRGASNYCFFQGGTSINLFDSSPSWADG